MVATEVDHLFVLSSPGAPEADELLAAGFREGTPNTHAGQGTACRRFFCDNAMLEFLYVVDIDVTRSGSAARTGLAERWLAMNSEGSPFGVCLRPVSGEYEPAPFASWTYGPKYLPGGVPPYEMSNRCGEVAEPFVFFTPKFARPDLYPAERRQPLDHPNGIRELTAIRLDTPVLPIPDLQSSRMPANLTTQRAERHHMYVEFDRARQQQRLTLQTLPVTLLW